MIEPALTAEEWAEGAVIYENLTDALGIGRRHSTAALCLHGQPFGFTWEDVAVLRDIAAPDIGTPLEGDARALTSLADRIEALLPPEDTP